MDPLSQALLGAALPITVAKRKFIKVAAICGAIAGLSPDLDILIRSASDPLMRIEYHRHFTHSLAFIPIGGLLVALGLWLLFFRKESFKLIYIFTTLGFATHGLLDACTSYGTLLYFPFSDERVSWNIISIIDPIFTGILLVFCILCLFRKSVILMRIGLFLSMSYLALGYIKHEQVKDFVYEIADSRGHKVERVLLNPTIGNNILWRTVYQFDGFYYVDAVNLSLFSNPILHEGVKVEVINEDKIFPELGVDSVARNDIRRFAYFSQGFIYQHPDHENLIADLRYGTLPQDNKSLWGIKVDTNTSDKHVKFISLRKFEDKHYDEFWLMLGWDSSSEN